MRADDKFDRVARVSAWILPDNVLLQERDSRAGLSAKPDPSTLHWYGAVKLLMRLKIESRRVIRLVVIPRQNSDGFVETILILEHDGGVAKAQSTSTADGTNKATNDKNDYS